MPSNRERLHPATKRKVQIRAKDYCEYCRCPGEYSSDALTVDHILPRQKGGTNALENLAWACFGCNGRKQAKTQGADPDTDRTANLYNPRSDRWADHFCWSKDQTRLVGKTPTGRATIEALDLNRENVVRFRQLLASAGLHPPPEPMPAVFG